MFLASPQTDVTLSFVEFGATAIAVALAFCRPAAGAKSWIRIESALASLARNKRTAVLACGAAALFLRLAILPLFPIPLPFIHDDFSFLLAADTFASGRLTNPTPAMWTHFETFHITMTPTYMSMYFPAQGLVLAAGKVLFGHAWFGSLIVSALLCSAICWMLQAWLPPSWALLGGMIAVLRLALFSYWINTYTGAGMIAALAGALVLGAVPRLQHAMRRTHGVLLAAGFILLAGSRPFEGLLLCLPVVFVLGKQYLFGDQRPAIRVLLKFAALPAALILAAGAWMSYYDYRAFGDARTLPYSVDRAAYSVAPYYVWQSQRPAPSYRHAVMRQFYTQDEGRSTTGLHTVSGYLKAMTTRAVLCILFFAGFALVPPLAFLWRALRDRRMRFLVLCGLAMTLGMSIEVFFFPHYAAPFTAVFYALGLQCMRHLRAWRTGRDKVGRALVRACVLICVGMAVVRLASRPLHIAVSAWPTSNWSGMWYGPDPHGRERAAVESKLASLPGKHLVIVRYAAGHNPVNEWVYNCANIDQSKIIWAREMDKQSNEELFRYYHDRRIWLIEPDPVEPDPVQPDRAQPDRANSAPPALLQPDPESPRLTPWPYSSNLPSGQ